MIDSIRDEAKSKGTGKWTTQVATDIELPVPTIDMAVAMRNLSKLKSLRNAVGMAYSNDVILQVENVSAFLVQLEEAFYFSMIIIYAQGMHLMAKASEEFGYELKLHEIAGIWKGGCIIRAAFLEIIQKAFASNPGLKHLLLDTQVQSLLLKATPSMRQVISTLVSAGISIPCYTNTLSYFDALRSGRMPSNLIQAQRDYFGAHTYELIGQEGSFHSEWKMTYE